MTLPCGAPEKKKPLFLTTFHNMPSIKANWHRFFEECTYVISNFRTHSKKNVCTDFWHLHGTIKREWSIKFEHVSKVHTRIKISSISVHFLCTCFADFCVHVSSFTFGLLLPAIADGSLHTSGASSSAHSKNVPRVAEGLGLLLGSSDDLTRFFFLVKEV